MVLLKQQFNKKNTTYFLLLKRFINICRKYMEENRKSNFKKKVKCPKRKLFSYDKIIGSAFS